MSKIIPFPTQPAPEEETDLSLLNREQLLDRLARLREQIAQLNAVEPRNQNSEAYEAWGDRHELLEDLVDDVLDRLDELE
ncbi:MAG: hypothetical protein ACI3U8_06380 [Candidatus Onthomonas sp.]